MSTLTHRGRPYRVLVDLNTQCDFLLPRGALPVSNRAEVLPKIRQLMNWARLEQVGVISSLEAHRPSESSKGLPPHCIDRTRGQRKLPFTLMPRRVFLQGDNTLDVPMDPFRRYQQVILTKRDTDFLSNPKADRLINGLTPSYWIIFGVTASHCVKAMVLGLLARQQHVVVVKDACGYWSQVDGEHAFLQMDAKGAILLSTDELISGLAEEKIRAKFPVPVAEDDDDQEIMADREGRNGDGQDRHERNPAASNGRRKAKSGKDDKRGKDISDFIPARLIRRKARSSKSSAKSPRDLA